MLGHVAQSVGAALPGSGLTVYVLGQAFINSPTTTSVVVPSNANFAFIEALGQGGYAANTNPPCVGGGGAGNDAIIPVTPGETLTVSAANAPTPVASSVSRGGTILVSANPGGNAASSGVMATGGSGKYPGSTSTSTTNGGAGGGRLGGLGAVAIGTINGAARPPGLGGGAASTSSFPGGGGQGAVCLTYFSAYDAALAFANSVYGGNWQP